MTERPPSPRDLPKSTRKYAPSAKRAARTSEARERIRRAAWDAFSTQGLDAASIAGIVRESGVSTGSFYNHFGSKEALFETFLEELAEERLGITRHLLAERLRKLEAAGVLRRKPYQDRPVRYEYRLTDRGKALYPVLVSVIEWANQNVPPPDRSAVTLVSRKTGKPIAPILMDANTGEEISHRTVTALSSK